VNLQIFEVGAGSCALLTAENGNLMLFDCGHDDEIGFRPSSYLRSLGYRSIQHLVISNFDQDHVSDIPNLIAEFRIDVLFRNRSISGPDLTRLKLKGGPLSNAMNATIGLHGRYVHPPPTTAFPGIEFETFCNRYPDFTDTNNLSVVSFVHTSRFSIVLPGDLEAAGWRALLKNRDFVQHLARVNIFVASHHGRENGFCNEVFDICRPAVILISDGPIKFDTQEFDYAPYARGIPDEYGKTRYVLTTRRHGNLTIFGPTAGGFTVNRERS
jgi:beta-lactamase superfamily II metal-dependent hydrolase